MHEGNFTEQIVEAILAELEKHPGLKPERVAVRVGEMLHLVPDSVQMHYELVTRGTSLEGAALDLTEEPVRIRCQACSREGGVEDHHLLMCAECGSRDVTLLGGEDVVIDAIEFENR